MADRTITTPERHPGVSTRTRREAFTALGFTGLAAIAVGGFARPDNLIAGDQNYAPAHKSNSDAALLAACAAFHAAHDEQERTPDSVWDDDDKANEVSNRWYQALQNLIDAPDPTTAVGRIALARVGGSKQIDGTMVIWLADKISEQSDLIESAEIAQRRRS